MYEPCADNAVGGVVVQTPDEHRAPPLSLAAPLTDQLTIASSPAAVPHAPPIEVTSWFVKSGNDTDVPFTFVSETTGAVLSIVTDLLPLEPVPPAFVWLAESV
jgi:hypothetical protein